MPRPEIIPSVVIIGISNIKYPQYFSDIIHQSYVMVKFSKIMGDRVNDAITRRGGIHDRGIRII
jgi:hypothetical protein